MLDYHMSILLFIALYLFMSCSTRTRWRARIHTVYSIIVTLSLNLLEISVIPCENCLDNIYTENTSDSNSEELPGTMQRMCEWCTCYR